MANRLGLLCVLAALLTACRQQDGGVAEPPPALSGGWSRQAVERLDPVGAPEGVKAFGPREWLRTAYHNGPRRLAVDIFLMPGETSAFEARQKWLGQAGAASMHHGRLFIVVTGPAGDAQELGGFLRTLEAEWLRAPGR